MQPILFAIAPIIVTSLTTVLKRIPFIPQDGSARYWIVRIIAALLSFGTVIVNYMLTGQPIDPNSLQTIVLTFMTFLGSVGGHEIAKQK